MPSQGIHGHRYLEAVLGLSTFYNLEITSMVKLIIIYTDDRLLGMGKIESNHDILAQILY